MNTTLTSSIGVSADYVDYLSLYYTNVTSHVITTDGKLLLAATKSKQLAVFSIRNFLKELYLNDAELLDCSGGDNDTDILSEIYVTQHRNKQLKPSLLVPLETGQPCLLVDTSNRLMIGGEGCIQGFELNFTSPPERKWTIKLPSERTLAVALAATDTKLYAGCSDNQIYEYDRNTLQLTAKLAEHHDFIDCLKLVPPTGSSGSAMLYSGSEDGSLKIWDVGRIGGGSGQSVRTLFPFKFDTVVRPQFGRWIGAIDVTANNEWLICGGGPALSLWHLSSGNLVQSVDSGQVCHVARFMPSDPAMVMFAGDGNRVSLWHRNTSDPAQQLTSIESAIDVIYSIEYFSYDEYDYNLYSFSGNSFQLELCKNAKYIDSRLVIR